MPFDLPTVPEIEQPALRATTLHTLLRIPDGKTILIACPALAPETDSPAQAILVTATLTSSEDR